MDLEGVLEKVGKYTSSNDKVDLIQTFLKTTTTRLIKYDTQYLSNTLDKLVEILPIPSEKYEEKIPDEKNCNQICTLICCLCSILDRITEDLESCDGVFKTEAYSKCFPYYIKICAQTQQDGNHWSNYETGLSGNRTMSRFIKLVEYDDVEKAIESNSNLFFKGILKQQLPLLTREKWKESFAAKSIFIYLLLRVKGDTITENLDMIIPFTLLMIDDFIPNNIIMGLKCIRHIFNSVPPAELRLRGRAEVIYDAIVRKLYSRDASVAMSLIPCVMLSLDCLETEMMRKRGCSLPKHDDCFESVLNNFHLSSNDAIRRVYAAALADFILRMGIQSTSHIKTILIVLEYGLESTDVDTMTSCIKVISKLVDAAWPRMEHHCEKLLHFLIRALYSIENDDWRWKRCSGNTKEILSKYIIETISKLSMFSPDLTLEIAIMLEAEENLGLGKYGTRIKQLISTEDNSFSASSSSDSSSEVRSSIS